MKFARQAQDQVQAPANHAVVAEALVCKGPVELELSQLKFVAGGGGVPPQECSGYEPPKLPHGTW